LKKWNEKFLFFLLSRSVLLNKLFALFKFIKRHKRLPRNLSASQATFEDYIFDRMTRSWSSFHESCVDKESAKKAASALSATVRTPRTAAVLTLTDQSTLEDVGKFLYPYIGKNLVAKPTHASGAIAFLGGKDLKKAVQQISNVFQVASRNYFFNEYERQYLRLPRKIIVEECLPSFEPMKIAQNEWGYHPPPDFRFYAARGKVLFCQFDQGRFADHRQALFTVPDHQLIPIPDLYPLPNPLPDKPAHWDEMIRIASELSAPFDFVRVDLYDLPDGIYFSEFTFTPNATFLPFQDRAFSRKLLEDVLKIASKIN